MDDFSNRLLAASRSPEHGAWQAFGLWVRLGAVGACLGAIGVTLLLDHTTALGSGLVWLVVGAAVAAFGARRAMAALRRAERVAMSARVAASTAIPRPDHQAQANPDGLRDMAAAALMLR